MNKTASALVEEHYAARLRRDILERAKKELREGFLDEAIGDLMLVVETLSISEERVIRLHAECVSMMEQASKILQLDASLRPVVVTPPNSTDPESK